MPFSVRKIPDHEVIEVSMLRPYQPYDRLILRDTSAGRTTSRARAVGLDLSFPVKATSRGRRGLGTVPASGGLNRKIP